MRRAYERGARPARSAHPTGGGGPPWAGPGGGRLTRPAGWPGSGRVCRQGPGRWSPRRTSSCR
ncbi:hypothetical protein E6R18_19975 [Streptomyces sp. A1277]|nr:hypothetical protein E6R18_19975 [Streptomyces sp. A1277]